MSNSTSAASTSTGASFSIPPGFTKEETMLMIREQAAAIIIAAQLTKMHHKHEDVGILIGNVRSAYGLS